MYLLQKINVKAFKFLINGRFKSFFQYINGRFLSLLFLGMIVSYFSISKLLDFLIVNYELFVWSVFFGMIIGSIYYLNKDFKEWNTPTLFSLILGISIGVGISFLDPAKENDNLWFVFFCGIISVSGMTLPGLSGSFILILLGNYVLLLVDSVNALYDSMIDILSGNFNAVVEPFRLKMIKVLAVFTLGSVTGLVSFSHILNYVLKRYKAITISTLMGFIVGSLGVVWPWKKTIYKLSESGKLLIDRNNKKIVEKYNTQTTGGVLFDSVNDKFKHFFNSSFFSNNEAAYSVMLFFFFRSTGIPPIAFNSQPSGG